MSTRRRQSHGAAAPASATYTKEQLMRSALYTPRDKDVLAAVLEDDQTYTHEQAAQLAAEFLKRKVTN